VLGRPTWYSVDQGAGIVFNRETALVYAERQRASAELQTAIDDCLMAERPGCKVDARPARELCRRQGGPDYLVLHAAVSGHSAVEWRLPPQIGAGNQSLFLYACRDMIGAEVK
jgi:hypothetical protein